MNKHATVWGQQNCTWCDAAIKLLVSRGYDVEERKIGTRTWTKEDLIKAVPTARTVPQVFIGDEYIGDYNALVRHLG